MEHVAMRKSVFFAVLGMTLIGVSILAYAVFFTDGNPSGALVRPQDKVVLSDKLAVTMVEPSLANNVMYADLIVRGEIISVEGFKWPLVTGTAIDEKVKAMSGSQSAPEFPFTKYLVKISDVYFGEADVNQIVEYVELGGLNDSVTKPQDKEQVILFLDKHVNGYYVTAIMEHSIFTVDASERLYAFSNQPGLSAYDGKPVEALVKDIRAEVKATK